MDDKRLFERVSNDKHQEWLKSDLLKKIKALSADELAEQLAGQIDKLEQEKIRDALTGAFNRGFIGAVLSQEIVLAQSSGQELGVLMLDIDHFKSINDAEPDGHSAGDRTLIELVMLLKRICGPKSLVGRYGGEEFVIITPHVTVDSFLEMAEDLGRTISGWLAKNAKLARPQVTASMGAVVAEHNEQPATLLTRADKLLYQAKESGRARLIFGKQVVKFA